MYFADFKKALNSEDLEDYEIFDSGDLELCFGDSRKALDDIKLRAKEIIEDGKFPLLIGGEHLVTLPAVEAALEKYPDLHIVHFDAHTDLRDDYLGAKLSHACVIRRCHDLIGDGRIHQFCIRSGEKSEFEFAKKHSYKAIGLCENKNLFSALEPSRALTISPFARLSRLLLISTVSVALHTDTY